MMWQPRAAQATAFQQAAELVAEAIGEPSLRPDPADPDLAGTFVQRVRQLPPAKREKIAAVLLQLVLTANLLLRSGMVATAGQLLSLAIALYTLLARAEE
jgi:hypothetical protein